MSLSCLSIATKISRELIFPNFANVIQIAKSYAVNDYFQMNYALVMKGLFGMFAYQYTPMGELTTNPLGYKAFHTLIRQPIISSLISV